MTWNVEIKEWHAIANWTWNAGDDVCSICRMPFDGCPPDCKVPGDDAPVVWGMCGHAFHLQCINKCLATQEEQRCPFCRRPWEFKTADAVTARASGGATVSADEATPGGSAAPGGERQTSDDASTEAIDPGDIDMEDTSNDSFGDAPDEFA